MGIRLPQDNSGGVSEIYFTDTTKFSTFITQKWSKWGRSRLVTKDNIDTFSNLTGNHQWIHEDEDRCLAESPYQGLIAHGLFILTFLPALLPPEPFLVVGHKQRIVRGGEFRFPTPIFPGDTVHCRARLRSVLPAKSGKGTVLLRDTEIWSTTGKKPAVTCRLMLQYF